MDRAEVRESLLALAVYCRKERDKNKTSAKKLHDEFRPMLAEKHAGSAEAYGDMMQRIESLEERV